MSLVPLKPINEPNPIKRPNPIPKSLLPKIGDKVFVSYRYWANGGKCVTKYRKGIVADVRPFEDGGKGYNVCIKSKLIFRHWHVIDGRNAQLAFEGYPEWAK